MDRPKVLDTVQPNISFAQYLQKATSSRPTSIPLGPKSAENEPATAKIAEMDFQPRRKYRKRNPLADYNKPPVRKTSAAEIQPTRLNPLEKSKMATTGEENNQPESSNGPARSKKSITTVGEKNQPGRSNGSASSKKPTTTAGEKNQPGRSNGPASSKESTTTVGEKSQPGSSNGPASSKKATTTVGEKRRVGKQNAPGAKSNLKEGLNNIPSASLPQLAKSNSQSPSCDGESTFLCFFCSETKAVKDRHPGRSNTCAQCHAYYMAQVAARKFPPPALSLSRLLANLSFSLPCFPFSYGKANDKKKTPASPQKPEIELLSTTPPEPPE